MLKLYLKYLIVIFPVFCHSQDSKSDFSIKTSPISIIDIMRPNFKIGVEKYISKKLSFNLSFDRNINYSAIHKFLETDFNNGYRINSEVRFYPDKFIRYYYKNKSDSISTNKYYKLKKTYFACELFFLKTNIFKSALYVYDYLNSSDIEEKGKVKIHKQLIGFTIKAGWIKYIKNFIVDLYLGAGVRYKFIDYDAINPRIEQARYIYPYSEGNLFPRQKWEGQFFTPNLSIGLNIGYLIKTKH